MSTSTRRATIADARAIASLQRQAWLRNYQDFVDPRAIAEVDEDDRVGVWLEELGFGTTETFVMEVAGTIYGFATVGPSREDGAGGQGEIWALYVDPAAQGAGLGTALLAEAVQALRAAGHRTAILRTLEGNGLARTFYERHGWHHEPDATVPHEWGPHVLYRLAL